MAGRRHSSNEIAAKMAHAKQLAAQGKSRRDIARSLGVSIMTYHRWTKSQDERLEEAAAKGEGTMLAGADQNGTVTDQAPDYHQQLKQENARLRQLVVEILLEKAKLTEELDRRRQTRVRGFK